MMTKTKKSKEEEVKTGDVIDNLNPPLEEKPEITNEEMKAKLEELKKVKEANEVISESVDFDLSNLEGVGTVRRNRLAEDGINTPMDLVVAGPVKIADITGLDVPQAEVLVTKAREYLQESGVIRKSFMKATQVLAYRETVLDKNRITTGCKSLDSLLGGGFELQAMTEFYGVYGCGKTQICHTAAVMAQLPHDKGGLNGEVIWIDTENTFRPERIRDIVLERGLIELKKTKKGEPLEPKNPLDLIKFLDKITVARAYNASHQMLLLNEITGMLKAENQAVEKGEKQYSDPKPVMLVVDSLTAHVRSEYLGRGKLGARQMILTEFVHKLVRVAETYNVAVVATNQVLASPDGFGDPIKPVGGNVLGHTSTYRIYLKKSGKKRVAKMDDSPMHASSEIVFATTGAGVVDIEKE